MLCVLKVYKVTILSLLYADWPEANLQRKFEDGSLAVRPARNWAEPTTVSALLHLYHIKDLVSILNLLHH